MDELERAAHRYIGLGLDIIALSGKAPNGQVHRHGLHDPLTGQTDILSFRAAMRHPQTTGVGILTGPIYYVVDIDGEEGAAQWKAIAGDEYMPDRWVAKTGRGLHLWYADFEAWPTTKLGPKLDFKGVGGYVAAPPSMHPDGHRYEWLLPPSDDEPPWAMPQDLAALLYEKKALREQAMVNKSMRKPIPVEDRVPGLIYNDVSFDAIIEKVRSGGEGNRNNLLYWAAATMAEDGASKEDMDRLLEAAKASGLASFEARRTIRSAIASMNA